MTQSVLMQIKEPFSYLSKDRGIDTKVQTEWFGIVVKNILETVVHFHILYDSKYHTLI